jgi:hypothetical protein
MERCSKVRRRCSMLKIEEYISRRKKEDGLNEFDLKDRSQNMKLCVDYVFEYFNNYLNITEAEERAVLQNEKMEKYRLRFRDLEGQEPAGHGEA